MFPRKLLIDIIEKTVSLPSITNEPIPNHLSTIPNQLSVGTELVGTESQSTEVLFTASVEENIEFELLLLELHKASLFISVLIAVTAATVNRLPLYKSLQSSNIKVGIKEIEFFYLPLIFCMIISK